MKRLTSLCALLIMLLFMSGNAFALSTTLEWDIPGSVMLKVDSSSGPFLDLGADQTSYTYSTSESYGYIYIYAANDYTLIDAPPLMAPTPIPRIRGHLRNISPYMSDKETAWTERP